MIERLTCFDRLVCKRSQMFAQLQGGHDAAVGSSIQPDACCAMHRDGSYYANITTIIGLNGSPPAPVPGFGERERDRAALSISPAARRRSWVALLNKHHCTRSLN